MSGSNLSKRRRLRQANRAEAEARHHRGQQMKAHLKAPIETRYHLQLEQPRVSEWSSDPKTNPIPVVEDEINPTCEVKRVVVPHRRAFAAGGQRRVQVSLQGRHDARNRPTAFVDPPSHSDTVEQKLHRVG